MVSFKLSSSEQCYVSINESDWMAVWQCKAAEAQLTWGGKREAEWWLPSGSGLVDPHSTTPFSQPFNSDGY